MKRATCPNCGGDNLSILSRGNEYFLLSCGGCRLVTKSTKGLTKARVQELQDSVYYDVGARTRIKINYKMAKDRLDILTRFRKEGKLLEIGCATGEFLELTGAFGFEVLGVDASERYSSYAIQKGLNVKCGYLEKIGLEASQFDIIAMFHLIEHIENPNEFLNQVYSYLKPSGLLFIVAPNLESFTNKLFGYKHPNFQQADHLFFYSKTTLRDFLQRAGFEIVDVSSKEYIHNPFTSLKDFLRCSLKNGAPNHNTHFTQDDENIDCRGLPVPSVKPQSLKSFAKLILNLATYSVGYFFYPILKPYGVLVEKHIKGHELVIIARKP